MALGDLLRKRRQREERAFVALLSRLDPKFYDARLSGFYVEAKGQ